MSAIFRFRSAIGLSFLQPTAISYLLRINKKLVIGLVRDAQRARAFFLFRNQELDSASPVASPVAGPLRSYLGETTAFSECLAALQLNRRRY